MTLLKIILILALLTTGANLVSEPDDLLVGTGLLIVILAFWLIYSLFKPLTKCSKNKPNKEDQ
jgi:hypothetical protein